MAKKPRSIVMAGITYYPIDLPAGYDGKKERTKRYCKSRNEAVDLKARIRHWKLTRKYQPDTVEITDTDKGWIVYLRNELGPDLSNIPSIVAHWKATAASVRHPCTVREMVTQYLAYRGPSLNPKTLADVRHRCLRFSSMFHSQKVHEITPADIRALLDHRKHGTSQRNDYKVLSPMFAWAREQSMVVVNPLNEIKRPKAVRTGPAILPIEAFSRLLKVADAKFPDLLPFLVLGGFAGLRTSEMLQERKLDQVVQWNDLRGWKMLEIRPEVAKITTRAQGDRRFVNLDPVVKHWLSPLMRDSGRILDRSQKSFRLRMALLEASAEIKIPKNGLRHSFASYWIAGHRKQGYGQLAINMGNSESVAKQHYVESLHPSDGKAWFRIQRD
jgi:integrase